MHLGLGLAKLLCMLTSSTTWVCAGSKVKLDENGKKPAFFYCRYCTVDVIVDVSVLPILSKSETAVLSVMLGCLFEF